MSKPRYRCCEHCADDSPHPSKIGHGVACSSGWCPGVVQLATPPSSPVSATEPAARPVLRPGDPPQVVHDVKADYQQLIVTLNVALADAESVIERLTAEGARLHHLIVQADSICSLILHRESQCLSRQTVSDLSHVVTDLREASQP